MVIISNDIKVLFTKYHKDVIIDDIGGEMLLYDNTDFCDFKDSESLEVLKGYVFTGISFKELPSAVVLKIQNLYGDYLDYVICNNYVFIKKDTSIKSTDPLGVVSFFAKNTEILYKQFYAHFIEKIN
jgi:hypothetical protein